MRRHALLVLGLCSCGKNYADVATRPDATKTMPTPSPSALPTPAPTPAPSAVPTEPPCQAPETAVRLPNDDASLGGAESDPPAYLVGDYGVSEGPGIELVARDGFRLFVNGHLLSESRDALAPKFVPITFLPGHNVVSVLVVSANEQPELGIRIDELSGPIFGSDQFRVSTQPAGSWSLPDFDASDWSAAVVGPSLSASGCELSASFSDADQTPLLSAPGRTQSAVFRFEFDIAPLGFGEATTGGGDAVPVLVSDVDSLLAALAVPDQPAVILLPEGVLQVARPSDETTRIACPETCPTEPDKQVFPLQQADMECATTTDVLRAEHSVPIGSNKTLVGLGRGAQLRGARLAIEERSNVIVRNLAITDVNPDLIEAGDGISINSSSNVWVDHCTFKWISDGFIDTQQSSGLSFSWLRNEGVNPAACNDRHPRANELIDSSATFHHCFWNHVFERAPLVNDAASRVHLFNNLVSDDAGYAVGSGCGAQVLVEASLFEAVAAPTDRRVCVDGEDIVGLIDATNANETDGDTGPHRLRGADADVPSDAVFTPPYEYTVEPVQDAAREVRERAGAGAEWAAPLE